MKRYSMRVERVTCETMLFDIDAESDVEAHEFAEGDVLAGHHKSRSLEVVARVVACHQVQETGKRLVT